MQNNNEHKHLGWFMRSIWAIHKHLALATYTLLVTSIACVLFSIVHNQAWHDNGHELRITNNKELLQAIEVFDQEAVQLNYEKPIRVKTGIMVHRLNDEDPDMTEFSASVWQTYDKNTLKKVTPGFNIAHAKKIHKIKTFEREEDDTVIIGWHVTGELLQETNLTKFPLEKKVISLEVEHQESSHNVMCVPDFDAYQITSTNKLPWIDPHIKIQPNIKTSFFTLKNKEKTLKMPVVHPRLSLNFVVQDSALSPLIQYVLPIMVIFFAMFAILWLYAEKRLEGFVGTFFATVMLHGSYRAALKVKGLTDLELFFLLIYVILIIVSIASILSLKREAEEIEAGRKVKRGRLEKLVKGYYWPAVATTWLLIALWVYFH